MTDSNLTVAVTGPTGTFGCGLMPLLEADERIATIVGIARRAFDPSQQGWTKMTYRQGDVAAYGFHRDNPVGMTEDCATLVHRLGEVRQRVPIPVITPPVPIPVITPPVPIRFLDQDDVGRALLLCIVGAGLPGMYNIIGDGVLSGAQLLREFGWRPRYSSLEARRDRLDGRSAERGES
jgi:hypothetical protein